MIERLALAFAVLIYATGCCATIVELYSQSAYKSDKADDDYPHGRLHRGHPKIFVLVTVVLVGFWPLFMTWHKVREIWR